MKTDVIRYSDEDTELEAYVALPESQESKIPAVILCHAWRGRDEFICERARHIAAQGYIGIAIDMYGKGVLGSSKEENAALKKPFLDDRAFLQKRLLKGFEAVISQPQVDTTRIAALGCGFGAVCALDLARSGAPIKGAVSIYGHFTPPPEQIQKAIQAKILVLHGYNDTVADHEELHLFGKEMELKKVDFQLHLFGNTMHAFANPQANDPASNLLYNPLSAARAWKAVEHFLDEIFKK